MNLAASDFFSFSSKTQDIWNFYVVSNFFAVLASDFNSSIFSGYDFDKLLVCTQLPKVIQQLYAFSWFKLLQIIMRIRALVASTSSLTYAWFMISLLAVAFKYPYLRSNGRYIYTAKQTNLAEVLLLIISWILVFLNSVFTFLQEREWNTLKKNLVFFEIYLVVMGSRLHTTTLAVRKMFCHLYGNVPLHK